MKIYIQNMVCSRCMMVVKSEIEKLGLHDTTVGLGEAEVMEDISPEQLAILNNALKKAGLELIDDKKNILVEKIKTIIIDLVHYNGDHKINLSNYLSEKLNFNYPYLANTFSQVIGTTIDHFYLVHKIEKVKELLAYEDLTLDEIAWKLHYSSVAHLSYQFKKMTGLTPTHYRNLRNKKHNVLGDMEIM